jgi:FkbM family methyltransferase
MANLRSRVRLARVKAESRLGGERAPVKLELAPTGAPFHVRPGTTDLVTLLQAFLDSYHLPPAQALDPEPRQICELGSNVGAGVVALAARFRAAKILGVEPDPENAALARVNVAPFGRRCRILETAIWDEETDLIVEGERSSGYTVRPWRPGDPRERAVPATTVGALLDDAFPDGPIDYLRLSIEGTEPRVLARGHSWAERVRSIRSELHPHHGFGADDSVALLEDLGFEAWAEPEDWGGFAFGVRR